MRAKLGRGGELWWAFHALLRAGWAWHAHGFWSLVAFDEDPRGEVERDARIIAIELDDFSGHRAVSRLATGHCERLIHLPSPLPASRQDRTGARTRGSSPARRTWRRSRFRRVTSSSDR